VVVDELFEFRDGFLSLSDGWGGGERVAGHGDGEVVSLGILFGKSEMGSERRRKGGREVESQPAERCVERNETRKR